MLRLSLLFFLAAPAAQAAPATPATQVVDALRRAAPPADGVEVDVSRVTRWDAGHFVRVQQLAWGLPVRDGELTVQLDNDMQLRRIVGTPIQAPGPRPPLAVGADQAVQAAQDATASLMGPGDAWWPARAELAAWADLDGRVHLVWEVATSRAAPVGTYRSRVSATTGEVLHWAPTLRHAEAQVYPYNPDSSELETVELLRLDGTGELDGTHVTVWSCTSFANQSCSSKTRYASADPSGDFFYEPDPVAEVDPFAETQMYFHVDKVAQFFLDEYGFEHPDPLESIVNFEFQNAFFGDADGDGIEEIAFGEFGSTDFAYDGDVIYHEFVHSVFARVTTAGFFEADEYGIDFAPLALNEGTADLFSMVVSGDPALGEYSGRGFGLNGPIRDLEPDRRCPYNLYGQQHTDGQIWASMGWNLIEDPRVGPEVAGQLTYGFLELLPREVSWRIAGDTVVTAADDLLQAGAIDQATRDAIGEHIEASGLVGCERIIPLDDGFEPTLFALSAPVGGPIPLTAQFSIEVPENAERLQFQVTGWRMSDPATEWQVFVRRGAFIRHDLQPVFGGIELPVAADYDAVYKQAEVGRDGTITLSDVSDPPLEPGATYYFAMAADTEGGGFGFSQGEARVTARVELGDPIDDPGDDGIADEDVGGCGCASTSPVGLAWLGLPWMLMALRRRQG